MTNPYVYYVSSVRKNNSNGGDGTLENPFEDLAVAFYHIKKKYNKLVLLEDGIYE